MEKSQIHFNLVNKHVNFDGKRILEIGSGAGDLVKYISQHTNVEFIAGIEYDLGFWSAEESKGRNWEITQGDVRALNFKDNSFDYVISIGVFEHIINLPQALKEIGRVLKPEGKTFALFQPIWSSVIGHHYNFWIKEDIDIIPPWGHLWMDQNEMYEHIKKHRGEETARNAIHDIYENEYINRLTRKDYYNIFSNSGLMNVYISETPGFSRYFLEDTSINEFSDLTDSQKEKILSKYSFDDIVVSGFEVVLQKNNYFNKPANEWMTYLKSGWSFPEEWGCWTDGTIATLDIPIPHSIKEEVTVSINAAYSQLAEDTQVYVNNQLISSHRFAIGKNIFNIKSNLQQDNKCEIRFQFKDVKSPKELNYSDDERRLGIGVSSIEVIYD